jgi:transcriptional regulator of acetoin/glycerol metabolism
MTNDSELLELTRYNFRAMMDVVHRDELTRKLYAEGVSVSELAKALGVTRQCVYQRLQAK